MKDKILIFGKGFIGSRINEEFGCDISEKRIRTFKDAEEEIKKYNPEIIINCIGHTGTKNVDDCELYKDEALFANVYIPLLLAEVALRNGIKMVHIGSGCIYNYDYAKDSPIAEEKTPDFFNLYYSRTKIYADRSLEALSRQYKILIARIRIPLDERPHPRNILTKLIGYKKLIDIPNSVTYIPDMIKALKHLINIDAKGIYNVVNDGALRYPELLAVYKRYVPDFQYEIIDYKKLNITRTNLVLSVKKLEAAGFKMRNIKDVFEECVKNYLQKEKPKI